MRVFRNRNTPQKPTFFDRGGVGSLFRPFRPPPSGIERAVMHLVVFLVPPFLDRLQNKGQAPTP